MIKYTSKDPEGYTFRGLKVSATKPLESKVPIRHFEEEVKAGRMVKEVDGVVDTVVEEKAPAKKSKATPAAETPVEVAETAPVEESPIEPNSATEETASPAEEATSEE